MRKWYPWILITAALLFSVAVHGRLPAEVPTHWNLQGEVDDTSSRTTAAFLMPMVMLVIALVLPKLPSIDPRRPNYAKFRPTYDLLINGVLTLMTVMHVATLGAALGWPISVTRVTPAAIGGLFIFMGNLLPRARPNWFLGIRTPWTLSNDRVWERTHRLGGYVFVAAGIVLLTVPMLPVSLAMPVLVATIVTASALPLAYSYVAWRQETSR